MTERAQLPPLSISGGALEADGISPQLFVLTTWSPVIIAALLLYIPAYRDLSHIDAGTDGAAQVPVCLAIWVWLIWRKRSIFATPGTNVAGSALGWASVGLAGLMYAIGRSQEFFQLELGSQVPLFIGIVLVMLGPAALRRLWFLPVFLLFLVPVPGSLMDDLLVPLKKLVSSIVANGLFVCGFPISHDGVVLYIGQYQLLIADACSGLNSMIALTAVGSIYVYLVAYRSWLANLILLAAILPIAFLANILRVTGLVLTTFYWGDTAGQRFHDFAAVTEILVALAAFFLLDRAIRGIRSGP